jgi:hypothetical protein
MNTTEIQKLPDAAAATQAMQQLDELLTMLGEQPDKRFIKTNKYANNAEYLPIGYIEAKLDQIFRGLWKLEIVNQQQVANGYVVSVRLSVYNWVANLWLVRDGIGAKAFEMEKGAHPTDFTKINAKGIEKIVPIAKAEAFKNAVKSLGNIFGRNLNREFKHGHAPDKRVKEIIEGPINA